MVLILWIISLGVMLTIVLTHIIFIRDEYNVLSSSFFNALTRPVWSLSLSIIIILCVNGYGGIVDRFLSYPIFTVLIRLNYNIYLLHLLVMMIKVGNGRTPIYISNFEVVSLFVRYSNNLLFFKFVFFLVSYVLGRFCIHCFCCCNLDLNFRISDYNP